MLELLLEGLVEVWNFHTIFFVFVGTALGILVGAIPGFGSTMALVLCLPFTFGMTPTNGMAMMLGVMAGGMSGGLISSVLLGIPGTAGAVVTTFDGFPMAENGYPGPALAIGTYASFFGGIIGAMLLIFFMPLLAEFALSFGPWEFFSFVFFGLTVIASLAGKSMIKGLISGVLGLLIATVGIDPLEGSPRLNLSSELLKNGFSYLAILVGLFSLPQLISTAERSKRDVEDSKLNRDLIFSHIKVVFTVLRNWGTLIVSSIIGVVFGILPGVGAASATFVAYDQSKRMSHEKEKFGTGCAAGIVASESCNNALCGGALIPALALGIPGDAPTAVILGALILHGIQPGPMLIFEQGDLVYGVFVAFLMASGAMLLLQLYGLRIFVYITRIKTTYLIPTIVILCALGTFSLENNFFDMWVMFLAGIIGYILSKFGFPLAPIVLGSILGPIAETNFRRALYTDGDPTIFLTRPISGFFIAAALLSLGYPILKSCIAFVKDIRAARRG